MVLLVSLCFSLSLSLSHLQFIDSSFFFQCSVSNLFSFVHSSSYLMEISGWLLLFKNKLKPLFSFGGEVVESAAQIAKPPALLALAGMLRNLLC